MPTEVADKCHLGRASYKSQSLNHLVRNLQSWREGQRLHKRGLTRTCHPVEQSHKRSEVSASHWHRYSSADQRTDCSTPQSAEITEMRHELLPSMHQSGFYEGSPRLSHAYQERGDDESLVELIRMHHVNLEGIVQAAQQQELDQSIFTISVAGLPCQLLEVGFCRVMKLIDHEIDAGGQQHEIAF